MTIPYKIYCDLDGVLVNFSKRALEVAGIHPDCADKKLRRDFWKAIERHVRQGNKFFESMEMMPDAHVLWEYIRPHDPIICSATGHTLGAKDEKREWVRKHLGAEVAFAAHFVRDGHDKALYAAETHILIDDRSKVIGPWVDAGGIGILHVTAERTISQLKEMGI